MPSISKRGQRMPASPIRKLVPYAEIAKKKGRKVFHLNIGQPDILTPKVAMDAMKNADIKILEYSHSAGNESLRKKIAQYYATYQVNIDHNQIIVTAGASEAIGFALMSCLDAGDEIIVPEPFYANYNSFALAGDIVIKPITASIETGFALPDMSAFEACITPRTKAIMICNPSNPTGYLYSLEELLALREICQKHDLYLMVDEVYREFCYDGKEFHSVLSLEGLDEYAIVFDSVSKRYSACGARIGMLVTKNKQVLDAAMRFAQARLSPPSMGQIAAEAAFGVENSYIENVIQEYDARRKTLIKRLKNMDGVVCPNPGGAFYAMVQLPVDSAENFCRWLLEEFEHEGQTVMLAPGEGFYYTKGLGKQEARIAYVLKEQDLEKAMDCLEAALAKYPHKQVVAANMA